MSEFKGAIRAHEVDATMATAHLPGLDIKIVRRRLPAGDAEQISIKLQAVPVGDHFERVLSSLGRSLDESDVIARAGSAEGARLMEHATDDARKLGIFGAPTFAVGTEIFRGDDRLEEAIAFASGC